MARAILAVAGVAWLLSGVAAFGVAAWAVEDLSRMLPPLAIDSAALGGATAAIAAASATLGLIHLGIVAALRGERSPALSAAILLAASVGGGVAVAAVACVTAAVSQPAQAGLLGLGAVATLAVATAYAIAASRLVSELAARARRRPRPDS